ncbi:MAG: DnaA/Hda family protein [Gammaproteobacteria bacterium]|nr:DnaA/Hda family protein [Gammaproteobacteria bacterium]
MRQLPLDLSLKDPPTFANFWQGSNGESWAAARYLAEGGTGPLYLWGPGQCGKTHLLVAAARLATEAGASCAYVSCDDAPSWAALADLPSDALVCIDGLEHAAGRPDGERALFLAFETFVPHRRLLLAAAGNPSTLPVARADLRTRLASGPVIHMTAPTHDDLVSILVERARHRGLELTHEGAQYLLCRSPREPRLLIEQLAGLDRAALADGRRLTLPFLRAWLKG